MTRKLIFLIFAFLIPTTLHAQYTAVQGTAQDITGNVYQNCHYSATFVGQSTQPGPYLASGSVFQQSLSGGCDGFGAFNFNLIPNSGISPTPSQWQLDFCDQTGKYCGSLLLTVTGLTQNITTLLSPVLPVLPGFGGGTANALLFGVTKIPLSLTAPSAGQCLAFTGAQIAGTTCGSGGGGGPLFEVNGSALLSSTTINFLNSAATNGQTLTFANPSAGNIQLGITGLLANSGLENSSVTVNTNTCTLGSSCTLTASQITTGTLPHAQLPPLVSGDIPNNAANTSGTAAGISTPYNAQQVLIGPPSGSSAGPPTAGYLAGGYLWSCVDAQSGTAYTVSTADQSCIIPFTPSASATITLPNPAATPAFGCPATNACFTVTITNEGTYPVAVTPVSPATIDGLTSISLTQYQSLQAFSDGTNYWTQRGAGVNFTASLVTNNIPVATSTTSLGPSLLTDSGTQLAYTGVNGLLISGPGIVQGNFTVGGALYTPGAFSLNSPWPTGACGTSATGFSILCINSSGQLSISVNGGAQTVIGGVTSITGDGTIIGNSASTGAVTLTLVNAAAHSVLGNTSGSSGAPSYTANPSVSSVVLNGATSGSATLSVTATGGTLNLGSTNATVTSAGAITVTGCTGCGGGGAALSAITNATGSNTLTNGNNPQTWNWALTTNSTNGLTLGETSASTATSSNILAVSNLASSTAVPLGVTTNATGTSGLTVSCPSSSTVDCVTFNEGGSAKFGLDKAGNIYISTGSSVQGGSNTANVIFQGGQSASTTGSVQGAAFFEGGGTTSNNANVIGGTAVLAGGVTTSATANAATIYGPVEVVEGYIKGSAVANVGDVVCMTTTAETVTDCSHTGPVVNIVGIAGTTTTPILVVEQGSMVVKLDNTAAVGDYICAGTTTDGLAHGNGSSACTAGQQIGYVKAISGSPKTISGFQTVSTQTLSSSLVLAVLHFK